jgi:hypothetical protein
MDARSLSKLAMLGSAVLLFTTGCPRSAPLENALTWAIKAATGRLTEATPREWQAVVEKIDQRTPATDIYLTDEQAVAIVEFVQANELNSIPQIVDLVRRAINDPSVVQEIEIPDSVMDLFGGDEFDFEGAVDDLLVEG